MLETVTCRLKKVPDLIRRRSPIMFRCISIYAVIERDQGKPHMRRLGGMSNRLKCQVVSPVTGVCQAVLVLIIVFKMMSSLRMQATSATFFGLPLASNFS